MKVSKEQKQIESDLAILRETTTVFACLVDYPNGMSIATFHFLNTSGRKLDEISISYELVDYDDYDDGYNF